MRLTDLAIVFVVIMLPIVIIVYVNTSFVVRAEREEMYYKNMINSAVSDATIAMKNVENDDYEIDYGYSGIVDNKVSVNANVAVDTFFTSLYNNLGIKGNKGSEDSFKSYIPALAIIDYDGIYIYSAEEYDGVPVYTIKPKKYFTYTYYIEKTTSGYTTNYEIKPYTKEVDSNKINANLIYQVTFTQDDYVFLKVYNIDETYNIVREISTPDSITYNNEVIVDYTKAFYLEDSDNNNWLLGDVYTLSRFGGAMLSTDADKLLYGEYDESGELVKDGIVQHLAKQRRETIAKICMEEVSYAVNAHNFFAKKAGIRYVFNFSVNSDSDWYETVDGIGILAIAQGISLGNRYLNYNAYSVSDLSNAKKYYLSDSYMVEDESGNINKQPYKMYHASSECGIYQIYLEALKSGTKGPLSPGFLYNKEEAAANGFNACYLCRP
ncbi:MAG: hypothetical protein IKV94_04520 [Clostridia bacterium]|nr:hypothetical protein [Clostridia bacterium]